MLQISLNAFFLINQTTSRKPAGKKMIGFFLEIEVKARFLSKL
jgi:hypothetical protein